MKDEMAHESGSSALRDVRFLTVAEVADVMRVSRMTVYRLVHAGQLPAIRFGRSFRVPESAVTQALESLTHDAGSGVADTA
jgi:excisionase family DNA binding protein